MRTMRHLPNGVYQKTRRERFPLAGKIVPTFMNAFELDN